MVELSNALNKSGKISERMSSGGVFSRMICKFSNIVTVACIDFGAAKTTLQKQTKNFVILGVCFFGCVCVCVFSIFH